MEREAATRTDEHTDGPGPILLPVPVQVAQPSQLVQEEPVTRDGLTMPHIVESAVKNCLQPILKMLKFKSEERGAFRAVVRRQNSQRTVKNG